MDDLEGLCHFVTSPCVITDNGSTAKTARFIHRPIGQALIAVAR